MLELVLISADSVFSIWKLKLNKKTPHTFHYSYTAVLHSFTCKAHLLSWSCTSMISQGIEERRNQFQTSQYSNRIALHFSNPSLPWVKFAPASPSHLKHFHLPVLVHTSFGTPAPFTCTEFDLQTLLQPPSLCLVLYPSCSTFWPCTPLSVSHNYHPLAKTGFEPPFLTPPVR